MALLCAHLAACFGRKRLACDTNGLNCEYTAMWRTRGNRVIFTLQAALQGWVAIGFSRSNIVVKPSGVECCLTFYLL